MLLSEIAAEARRAVPGGLAAFSFEEQAERPRPWHKILQKGKIKAGSSRGRPGKEQAAKLRLAAVPRVLGEKATQKVRSKLRSFYYFIFFSPNFSSSKLRGGMDFFFFFQGTSVLAEPRSDFDSGCGNGEEKEIPGEKSSSAMWR